MRQLNIKECHEILLYNILYIFYRTRGDYDYSVRCGNYQQYSNYFSIGPLSGFCAIIFRMVYLNFAGFCFFFVLLSYPQFIVLEHTLVNAAKLVDGNLFVVD